MFDKIRKNKALVTAALLVLGVIALILITNRLSAAGAESQQKKRTTILRSEINDQTRELSGAVLEALQKDVVEEESRTFAKHAVRYRQDKRDSFFRLLGRKDVLDVKKSDAESYDEGVVQPGLRMLEISWGESHKNIPCQIEQPENACYPVIGRRLAKLRETKQALELLEKKK